MIDMLLNASVSGGIVILLWGLSYPLSRKYFKASWHYAVLKITMLFMVFPVSIFASTFNGMFGELFVKPELPRIYKIPEQIQMVSIDAETVNSINSALTDIVFPAVQYSPPTVQTDNPTAANPPDNIGIADINITDNIVTDNTYNTNIDIPYLQIIWLVVGTVMFAVEIKKMRKFKRQILSSSNSNINHETLELFLQCKKELRVRGRVTLRTSEYIKTPLAFGIIRPFVVFPETEMSGDEKRIALIHELTHIKNGDLWVKFFASVISAVHWFNPLSHMLRRRIAVVSEEYCDECVVKAMTKEERFIYGNLILKVVSDIAIPQSTFCSTLSASTKNLKRRLFNMMNIKKSRKSMVALSVIAALILCSFATIYACAASTSEQSLTSDINSEKVYTAKSTAFKKVDDAYSKLSNSTEILDRADNYFTSVEESEPGDNLMTYDEFKELIETIVKPELQGLLGTEYTQEEIDKKIAIYEKMLGFLSGENFKVWKCYPESINGWYFYTSLYLYNAAQKEGDKIGFGGNTYESLYKVVSDYFQRQIKAGKMKLEEAVNRLNEMSPESTEVFVDGDWKRIENPPHIK